MIVEDQSAAIALLADPATYGPGIDRVERIETHGALVFLAGKRAYKMKRAVRFPYMDFSTRERRRQFCAAGRLTEPLVRALAEALTDFHGQAERRDDFGGSASYATLIDGIAQEFRRHAGTALDAGTAQQWVAQAGLSLNRCGATIAAVARTAMCATATAICT